MKARVRGTDKEKPPRRNPGGQKEPIGWISAFDRPAAYLIFRLLVRKPIVLSAAAPVLTDPSPRAITTSM
jgi:hypothetical protein